MVTSSAIFQAEEEALAAQTGPTEEELAAAAEKARLGPWSTQAACLLSYSDCHSKDVSFVETHLSFCT